MTMHPSSLREGEFDEALRGLGASLLQVAGDQLVGCLLFGDAASAARPAPGLDLELIVCLTNTSPELLDRLALPLRNARRRWRLVPMIVTPAEIARAADVFPVRFRALQRSHVLLAGRDPLAGVTVSRRHLRLRVEQELRNQSLRLRQRYLLCLDDPLSLAHHARRAVLPLARILRGLIDCIDPLADVGEHPRDVFAAVSSRFALHGPSLAVLLAVLEGSTPDDPTRLFRDLLDLLEHAVRAADALPEESER